MRRTRTHSSSDARRLPTLAVAADASRAGGEALEFIPFVPTVARDRRAARYLSAFAKQLVQHVGAHAKLEEIRLAALESAAELGPDEATEAKCCISLLVDLVEQGWVIRADGKRIEIAAGAAEGSPAQRKAKVQAGHHVGRNAQLTTPSVRRFISELERPRPFKGSWRSVFSLMRDGRQLADALDEAAALPVAARAAAVVGCVDPYVQTVTTDATCEFTGLRLIDIWRYFRHTWTTAYKSTPGRKMYFLIRDRAAECHPVIGIGALGSGIVQMSARDAWIGWTGNGVLKRMIEAPSAVWANWLHRSLEELISGRRTDDLLRQTRLRAKVLSAPDENAILRLQRLAVGARAAHRKTPQRGRHKEASGQRVANWRELSETHLFQAKRAESLAVLLAARLALREAGFLHPTRENLSRALSSKSARKAIETIVRQVKARHVGVDLMDITVCGAVAPYGPILGGKLVSLLMASPTVVQEYQSRYSKSASIIASAMAGVPVRRRPHLVLLGTTSLYNVAPSQYNRLKVPKTEFGGQDVDFEFLRIGETEGYGSHQFSQTTNELLERLIARSQDGRRVNSIFGEGVSPKFRRVRGALDSLGLDSDRLLQHGSSRAIYAVPLSTNFRDVLIGLSKRPKYILPESDDGTQLLIDFWRRRWLSPRILSSEVRSAVRVHGLSFPVTHGARVRLPDMGSDGPLFDQR